MIQCECGGALEITRSDYGKTTAVESYQCASCKRKGTYTFGDGHDEVSGCVVKA